MNKKSAVSNARRVNRLVIQHKKAGRKCEANQCLGMRNLWMAEARRA